MAAEAGVAEDRVVGEVLAGASGEALAEAGVVGESVVEKGDSPSVGVLGTLPTTCLTAGQTTLKCRLKLRISIMCG